MGVRTLKGRIRDERRLLRSPKLSEDAVEAHRDKLQHLERELAQQRERERERATAIKYRKVKFFERRKIERKLESLRKVDENSLSSEQLQRKRSLENMLLYVRFYPKGKKYVSLLKDPNDPNALEREQQARSKMWAEVMRRVKIAYSDPDELAAAQSACAYQDNQRTLDSSPVYNGMQRLDENATANNAAATHKLRYLQGSAGDEDDFFVEAGDNLTAYGEEKNAMKDQNIEFDTSQVNGASTVGTRQPFPAGRDTRADHIERRLQRQNKRKTKPEIPEQNASPKTEGAKPTRTEHSTQPNRQALQIQAKERVYEDEGRVEKMPARTRKEGGRKRVKRKKA